LPRFVAWWLEQTSRAPLQGIKQNPEPPPGLGGAVVLSWRAAFVILALPAFARLPAPKQASPAPERRRSFVEGWQSALALLLVCGCDPACRGEVWPGDPRALSRPVSAL
jgi:hypothetical protein